MLKEIFFCANSARNLSNFICSNQPTASLCSTFIIVKEYERQSKAFTQALSECSKSLNDVSVDTGVSITDLENLRDGTKLLSPRDSIEVAKYLGIELQDLLTTSYRFIDKNARDIIGAYIRFRREAAGMTQEEFAAALQTGVNNLSRIENGHAYPSAKLRLRIATLLGMDVLGSLMEKTPPKYL